MRLLAAVPLAALGTALLLTSLHLPPPTSNPQPPTSNLQPLTSHLVYLPGLAADSAAGSPPTPLPTPTPAAPGCPSPRSNLRILADPAAAFDRTPQPATIPALLAEDRPASIPETRILPFEARVLETPAWLRFARRTSANTIELLVSAAPTGDLLRVQLPGPGCTAGAPQPDRDAIEAARLAYLQACGAPPTTWQAIAGPVTLRGVPHWGTPDPTGTQGAPTGIELAPVLHFQKTDRPGCNPASYQPTPTPTPGPAATLELLINIQPIRVARGGEVTVTIIVQRLVPGPGPDDPPTIQPGPPGIQCSYTAYDRTLTPIASGGPAPTGPDGRVSWTFTVPLDAALSDLTLNQNGRVLPSCEGIPARGGARLEIVEG